MAYRGRPLYIPLHGFATVQRLFFLPCIAFFSLPPVTMPIAGAHAVAGAYLHLTAARDKLPEMLFAGNMIGGAFGVRARLCARGRSGGRMFAPRGGATTRPTAYLIRWDVLRMKPSFFFQKLS